MPRMNKAERMVRAGLVSVAALKKGKRRRGEDVGAISSDHINEHQDAARGFSYPRGGGGAGPAFSPGVDHINAQNRKKWPAVSQVRGPGDPSVHRPMRPNNPGRSRRTTFQE